MANEPAAAWTSRHIGFDRTRRDPSRLRGGRVSRARAVVACRVAVPALALLLAACATYTPQPIAPAETAQAFAARRLDAAELSEAVRKLGVQPAWPPTDWNRADLLLVAIVQNPQLAVARAESLAAAAKETGVAQTANPGLTLQSEYARDEAHAWLYGFALDFVVRSPARKRLDIDIAKLGTAVARSQVLEQTWSVRRALTSALSDAESARRRADVLDRLLESQQHLLRVQQQRVDAGQDAPSDLVVARSALLELERQRADARGDLVNAQSAVASALGMPPEALDALHVDWPDWGQPPALDRSAFDAAKEGALLARADLAASIADYAGAEKQLERAIARQYPEFHLNPGYYWDHGVAKWPLDLALVPSIFNRNEGEIAEAHAARELAGERMLAVQAGIYGAIAAAARAEAVAAGNVESAGRRVRAAGELVRHAQLAVRLGASDRAEQLGSDATALRAELDLVQARAQWQSARNALEDALHAPLSGPELALRDVLAHATPETLPAERRISP